MAALGAGAAPFVAVKLGLAGGRGIRNNRSRASRFQAAKGVEIRQAVKKRKRPNDGMK